MARALETGAVIVNADSQQLYDGLRVLTARPTEDDEARVPHRLYGVADPAEAWSVGRWLRAVLPLIEEEERPLILVGGTGLYFHALTRGLAPTPPVPDAVRQAVQSRHDAEGEAASRAELKRFDPQSEAAISPGDRQRLVRALAVQEATGRSLSDWRAETRPVLAPGSYEALVVERSREDLYARCDARVETMIAQGALDEVRAVLDRELDLQSPAMKAVGLRELAACVRGQASLADAIDRCKQATRNYAKRQLTWFRNQTPDWPRLVPDLADS